MSNYDNTNRGQIWPNQRKERDTHPDFTGTANINGVEHWVSAWKRKPDANPKAPSLSFSFKVKEEAPQQAAPQTTAVPYSAGDDSDIPF